MPGGNATAVWHFRIEGMGGPICALLVSEVIRALPGVHHADVTVGRCALEGDPHLLTAETVTAALGDEGYTATAEDLRWPGGNHAEAARAA